MHRFASFLSLARHFPLISSIDLVDGYFGDPHDCRLYHVCVDGRDYRSMCAPGLAWESLLRLCLPSHLVHCPNSKNFDMTFSGSHLCSSRFSAVLSSSSSFLQAQNRNGLIHSLVPSSKQQRPSPRYSPVSVDRMAIIPIRFTAINFTIVQRVNIVLLRTKRETSFSRLAKYDGMR